MAVHLLPYVVADLCLGKPPLPSLPLSASIADALLALKSSRDNFITIWSCDHSSSKRSPGDCVCIGKLCMVDIICFLCRDENLDSPALALKSPVSVVLPESESDNLVRHVEPSSSLLDAIDLFLRGTQNLIIPISGCSRRKQLPKSSHNGQEFCCLTQEDVIRFLLGSIGLFSPIPTLSISSLGIITHNYESVNYHSPASSAIPAISRSLADQTSVAVVSEEGILIGEISPFTLACCDETAAAAIMTLSAGDLLAYIDCGGPPEDLLRLVEERLKEQNLDGMLDEVTVGPYTNSSSNSTSSDEEMPSPTRLRGSRSGRFSRSSSYSARMVRRAEAIVCHPGSSLIAVMIQAIAHRVNYVWVMEDDCSVIGIVTFGKMLEIFRQGLEGTRDVM